MRWNKFTTMYRKYKKYKLAYHNYIHVLFMSAFKRKSYMVALRIFDTEIGNNCKQRDVYSSSVSLSP